VAEISLIDNDERNVAQTLEDACATADQVRIAVAFAKEGGVAGLPALTRVAERGRSVQLLTGIDFHQTDLSVLERFERPPSEARVYLTPDSSATAFHPKLYLAQEEGQAIAIIRIVEPDRGRAAEER